MLVCHIPLRKKEGTESRWPCGEGETALILEKLPGGETFPWGQGGAGRGRGKKILRSSRGTERLLSEEQGAETRLELYTFFLWSKRGPHGVSATQKATQWTEITTRRKDPANKVPVGRRGGVVYTFISTSVAFHLATVLSLFKTQTVLVHMQVKSGLLRLKDLFFSYFGELTIRRMPKEIHCKVLAGLISHACMTLCYWTHCHFCHLSLSWKWLNRVG